MEQKQEYKNIWVFIETEEGKAKPVGFELLTPGRLLADKIGEKLVAVIPGYGVREAARQAAAYGADEVLFIEGEEYRNYRTDVYADCMTELVERHRPLVILMGATNNGRDLGPRLACRLKTGLTADCTALDIDSMTKNVEWTRPAFGGNLMATILCPEHRPQMSTVRPGVMQKLEPDDSRQGEIINVDVKLEASDIRTQVLEIVKSAKEMVSLTDADVIVSGGRGMKSAENFGILKELADVLGGTVGCSRAAVDAGWMPQTKQVGQTGSTVTPKIYFACAISGAVQHVAGMSVTVGLCSINSVGLYFASPFHSSLSVSMGDIFSTASLGKITTKEPGAKRIAIFCTLPSTTTSP